MVITKPDKGSDVVVMDKTDYRRVSIVATLVTFGISSLWGSLLSEDRFFPGTKVVYK